MPQMSPSLWTLISIFEMLMFLFLIMKIYYLPIYMKFNYKNFNFKKKINWKWK